MVRSSGTSRASVLVLLFLCALTPAEGLLREVGRWFRNQKGTDESSAGNSLQVNRYSVQGNVVSGQVYFHATGACSTPITGDDFILDKPFVFTMFYLGEASPWSGSWSDVPFVQWKTADGDMLEIKTSGSDALRIYQQTKAGTKPWTFDLNTDGPGFHFLSVSVREVGNELRVFVNNDGEVKGAAAGTTFQPMPGVTEFRIGCEGAGTWTASIAKLYDVRYWVGDLGNACPGGSATSTFHGGMCYGMDGKASAYDVDKCQKSFPAFPGATTHAEVHDKSTDMFLTIFSHSNGLKDRDLYVAYVGDPSKRGWQGNPDAWSWATGNPNDYKTLWCGDNQHQRNDWRSIGADDDCQGSAQPNKRNDNCAQYAAGSGPGLLDRGCTRGNSRSLCSRDISKATCATFTCPPTKRRLDDVYCNANGCLEAECCTDDVLCATAFTCSAGFAAKPAADEVVCKETGTPACDDTTCCNAVCSSFTCPAGSVQKAGKGGKVCGDLPTTCNENKCCDAFCSGFTCPAFRAHKAAANTTKCTSAADCTSALCCDALCGSYTCDPAALRDKVDKDTLVCGPLATACNDQTCCDVLVTCAAFTCPAAFLPKNPVPLCGIDPAECTRGKCCDAKVFCNAYTCPTGFESKPNPATILCGTSTGDCKGKCCNAQVMCNQFTCSAGFQHKPNKGTIVCGIAVPDCSDAICCDQDVECNSYTCTAGTVLKPTPNTILCGVSVADCTNTLCCDTTCDMFTCSSTEVKKPGSVICGAAAADCTNAKCCDAKVFCDNAGFTCGARRQLKPGADALQCGIAVSDCTKKKCCDFVCASFACGTGFQDKPSKDTIVCGSASADCTKATCCDAQVFCDTFTCQAGKRLKATAPAVSCGLATSACSSGLCCDDLIFCGGHTCGAGFLDLPNKATTVCGITVAECTSAKCCDAATRCDSFTCTGNRVAKADAATLACGATVADCTLDMCCDLPCSSHTCGAAFRDKLNPAAVLCTGTPPVCTDATCCDALIMCDTFTCLPGFQDKAGKATVECGILSGDCADALCCNAVCSHSTFACPSAYQKIAAAATTVCGAGALADCNDDLCCEALCDHHTCGTGFQDKATKATIACGASNTDCSDNKCCDTLCSNTAFSCSTNFKKIAAASSTMCGTGALADCTDAVCCEAVCSSLPCGNGLQDKDNKALVVCGKAASDCNEALCCDVLCSNAGFSCPTNFQKLTVAPVTVCGSGVLSDCTGALCCEAVCSAHTCGVGYADKAGKDNVVCGTSSTDCSNTTCCDAVCSNAGFACAANFRKIAAAATTVCGSGALADCADPLCCTPMCSLYTCGAGYRDKAHMGTIVCGTAASDCNDAVCCNAVCSTAAFSCSTNFKKIAAAATTVCGSGALADCTDAVCCEALCGHQTCGTGFQDKATKASIVCGASNTDCNNAMCCDALCSNTAFSCSTNFQKIAAASSTMCGTGALADCTDAVCCEAVCSVHTCGAGFADKAGKATVVCGALTTDCNDATCCDAVCSNFGFLCSKGLLKLGTAPSIVCGADATTCNDALCCETVCSAHTCSAGNAVKRDSNTIVCGKASSDCSDALCCDAACSNAAFSCSTDFQKIAAAATTVCGSGALADCTDAVCCEALCGQHTCSTGFQDKSSNATIVCGASNTDCNDAVCCDALCSNTGLQCAANFEKIAAASSTVCGTGALANCTDAVCCEAVCSVHTCGAGFADKAGKATVVCGALTTDCNDATCCDAVCSNNGFLCSKGLQKLGTAPSIVCGADATTCNDALCCETVCSAHTCSAGNAVKRDSNTIVCGKASSDCSDALCCDAVCSNAAFSCSTDFQKIAAAATTVCGSGVLIDCTDSSCCEPLCSLHTCGIGHVDKAGKATIVCGAAVSDCNSAKCCDTLCSHKDVVCPSQSEKIPDAASVTCGAASTDCADTKCCNAKVFCDNAGFTCGTGMQLKPGADALQCGIAVSDCTKKTCCDFVCASFACGMGFQDKPSKDTIVCGGSSASDCTKATCCDAQVFCDTFTCQAGKRLKATAPAVSCGLATSACSSGLCCDDLVFCDGHTCGSDFQKLDGAEKIECGLIVAECSNSLCCERVTSAPPTSAPSFTCSTYTCPQSAEPKTGAATTVCGARPGDCTATKCCQNLVLKGSSSEIAQSKESGDAATAAAAVSTSGGRIKALMKMECKVEDVDLDLEPLDWEFHPLTFGLGSHQHKYFLGAVVGNFSLLGLFLILNYLSALMLVHVFGVAWETAVYYARAPGLVYIPLVWLLMGTSMAASNMAFFPSRAPVLVAVAGWLALIACAAMPVGMWFGLLRPSRFHAVPVPDPRVNPDAAALVAEYTGEKEEQKLLTGWRKTAYIFVFGSWVWVRKPGASDYYVEEWGLFFETYRKGFHWFSIVEMTQIMFLAFASAWKPHTYTYCVIRNVMITLVLLIFFAVIVYFRPYNSTFDYLVAALMSGLMFFAVLFMTISICLRGEPPGTVSLLTNLAGILLFASALLLAAKGLYDIVLYLTDIIFVGRRKTAQKAAREGDITEWINGEPGDGRRNLDGFTSEGSLELDEMHLVTRGGLQPFESSQTYSRLGEEDRSDHARPLEVYDTKNVLELEESRIVTTPPLAEDTTSPLSQRESPAAAQQRSSASVIGPAASANPLSVHMTRSIYAGRSRTVSDTVVGGSTPKPVRANSEKSMNMSSARARGLRGAAALSNTDLSAAYEIKPYITKV